MNETIITSAQNPRIKELLSLSSKSSERRKSGLFVIEGARECSAAAKASFEFHSLYIVPGMSGETMCESFKAEHIHKVSADLYQKIAYRGTTEGIIAIARAKEMKLRDVKLSDNPLIILLEAIEKPGNLGAVLRTADAAMADAIIVCDPLTDLFNPNIIRSSLGGIFTNQVVSCTSEEAYKWLKENKISIFTAELQASEWYHLSDMRSPLAIVMGTEAEGLKEFWRERADKRIKIPMRGELDSLNVSVSTAIICFEALRQRNFK